jgi:hypothetical protein
LKRHDWGRSIFLSKTHGRPKTIGIIYTTDQWVRNSGNPKKTYLIGASFGARSLVEKGISSTPQMNYGPQENGIKDNVR